MSDCVEAASPVAPLTPPSDPRAAEGPGLARQGGETWPLQPPSSDARAARLAKFEREQRIVDYLNRGVSVVEMAARVDVSEKRMRAIIRDPRTGSGVGAPYARAARGVRGDPGQPAQ